MSYLPWHGFQSHGFGAEFLENCNYRRSSKTGMQSRSAGMRLIFLSCASPASATLGSCNFCRYPFFLEYFVDPGARREHTGVESHRILETQQSLHLTVMLHFPTFPFRTNHPSIPETFFPHRKWSDFSLCLLHPASSEEERVTSNLPWGFSRTISRRRCRSLRSTRRRNVRLPRGCRESAVDHSYLR